MVDPRKVVGNHIREKAKHVTSDAECKRRYGSNWNTKTLYGVVVNVENIIKQQQKAGNNDNRHLQPVRWNTKDEEATSRQYSSGFTDDIMVETPPLEKGPRQYLQQQIDRQIDITIQETTINDNRVTKNDTIINYMIT
jgi:hypothetical protein